LQKSGEDGRDVVVESKPVGDPTKDRRAISDGARNQKVRENLILAKDI